MKDEKVNNEVEFNQIINDFTLNNIPRCLKCNLISSLRLNYKDKKPMIYYYCENNHNGNIPLEEYLQKYNINSLLKQKCENCNKSQNDVKGDFFYCSKCNKFICYLCLSSHQNKEKHNTTNIKRYDSLCKIHSYLFGYYCEKCKMNICAFCYPHHKAHELIDLSEYNFKEDIKNKFNERFKNLENKIVNLDKIKEEIINEIDIIKKSSELEMKFYKILINTYKYIETENNLNYNVIQNLKNFERIFELKKTQYYEKVYEEGIKYISYLKDIREYLGQTNLLKNNFKTLNNHSRTICHLSQLKDGRLISSSYDNTLNIYEKDTFELQLSIKEHSNYLIYFSQLNNDQIITCSADNTMNIIKLIDEDKYQLEQKLTGNNDYVCNVIELRDNELISVSQDNTMKRWEIINNNKFECTKTIIFQSSNSHCNILKLNENEFVTSSCGDKYLKFWNSNDCSNIAIINNIDTVWTSRTLCIIDDDILCVGGKNSKGFYLIKISSHQIIKNILGPQIIYSMYLCFDGLLLCSVKNENESCKIVKYKYENQNMIKIVEKEKIYEEKIFSCFELDEGIVASGGNDKNIKLWSN